MHACFPDLNWINVRDADEAWKLLKLGRKNQSFASTHMNQNSSRRSEGQRGCLSRTTILRGFKSLLFFKNDLHVSLQSQCVLHSDSALAKGWQ